MLTLIDNYDSFTYNLVHFLGELGASTRVYRNDKVTVDEVLAEAPEAIVLSPGPCDPDRGIDLAEYGVEPGAAAEHRRLAGDHAGIGLRGLGDQRGGDITVTDVFAQGGGDQFVYGFELIHGRLCCHKRRDRVAAGQGCAWAKGPRSVSLLYRRYGNHGNR